jgi:glycosyltransferase involved in cell wall biosynthesis
VLIMKVLILAEWLDDLGGCETFMTVLCQGLVAAGVDASVFVAAPNVHERWRAALPGRLAVTEAGEDPVEALVNHVRHLRPDIVHAVPIDRTAFGFAAIEDRPLLVGTEASDGSDRCHWPTYGSNMIEVMPRLAALHCFSSRAMENVERCFGYRGPSAMTTPLCAFPDDRRLWSRRQPSLRLVGWGRLSTEKGWTFVIESLAKLRRRFGPLELDLWGRGPLQPVLEQLIASCGERGRVRLRGAYPDHATLDIDQYDAALVPSFFEGLPYSLLEALWGGIPSVMTRISDAPDLMPESPLCRFIDPGDQDQLAAALAAIYDDYGNMAAYAGDRRAVVAERCSPAAVVPTMVDIYRRALSVS